MNFRRTLPPQNGDCHNFRPPLPEISGCTLFALSHCLRGGCTLFALPETRFFASFFGNSLSQALP
jgi:hypothetical protein